MAKNYDGPRKEHPELFRVTAYGVVPRRFLTLREVWQEIAESCTDPTGEVPTQGDSAGYNPPNCDSDFPP